MDSNPYMCLALVLLLLCSVRSRTRMLTTLLFVYCATSLRVYSPDQDRWSDSVKVSKTHEPNITSPQRIELDSDNPGAPIPRGLHL